MEAKFFPYGKQFIDDDDVEAVIKVLNSSNLTQGPEIEVFENNFANYVDAKYAVTFNSATSALHCVNIANGISENDICVVPANTFVATANSYEYVGAQVHILDIDTETRNIDLDRLEELLATTEIKSLTCVHYAGTPVDMARVHLLSKKHGFKVVEDACHAVGGLQRNGNRIGSAQYSDACVFSFHPVKGVTSGEGGIVTTNDFEIYKRLLRLRSHGINKSRDELILDSNDVWYYEQQELGYNYRMTDISAALGNSQLKKLPQFITKRRHLAKRYDELFADTDIISTVSEIFRDLSGLHLYVIDIPFENIRISKSDFMLELRDQKIGTQVHYIPLYRQPYFKMKYNIDRQNYKNSEMHYASALSIPLYFALSDDDQDYIVSTINKLICKYV